MKSFRAYTRTTLMVKHISHFFTLSSLLFFSSLLLYPPFLILFSIQVAHQTTRIHHAIYIFLFYFIPCFYIFFSTFLRCKVYFIDCIAYHPFSTPIPFCVSFFIPILSCHLMFCSLPHSNHISNHQHQSLSLSRILNYA